mmetsp:Transcript_29811/g.51463  ORF Transcript_29811/g.51463 Transcript_29811/m.51463 type:complete len:1285 (+) Transcript_29811:323-4177(+)
MDIISASTTTNQQRHHPPSASSAANGGGPPPWSGRHLAVALLPLSGGPLQQHPLVVVREHLDELLHRALKVRQHVRGHRRPRVRLVLLDVAPELGLVLVGLDLLQAHQPQVAPVGEGAVRVVHVGDAPAHARGEVPPGGAQHHRAAPGHVLAAVVAHALHHGQRARVAHAEPLAGLAPEEGLAGRGPVQAHVAHDHVVLRHEALRQRGRLRVDGDLAAAEALAHVVVGVAVDLEVHALGDGEAQALAGVAGELEVHGALGQALGAVLLGDVVGEHGAHGAVQVGDGQRGLDGLPALQGGAGQLDEPVVQGVGDAVVLLLALDQPRVLRIQLVGGHQQRGQVQALGLVVQVVAVDLQHVRAAHHLLKGAEAHLGHVLPHLLGQQEEVVDHVLGLAVELLAQVRVLRGDAHGAGVQVALAHHDAAQRDEGPRGEAHLLGAQQRGHHHVAAVADLPVRLQPHARPQVVQHQRLLRLGHAQLPGQARALHARPGRRARAAVVPRDHNVVRLGLGHARRDHAHAHLGHQLHRDLARGLRVLQVVDQLRQVLDGVDVVVRRGGDQGHARGGRTQAGDVVVNLGAGQLAALAGLRALRDLDLELLAAHDELGGDAEAAGGHLLDLAAGQVALLEPLQVREGGRVPVLVHVQDGPEAHRVLAALARVALAAHAVERDAQRLVRLAAERAQRHAARAEPLHDLIHGLHLVQGDGPRLAQVELQQVAQRGGRPVGDLVHVQLVQVEARLAALADGLVQLLVHRVVVVLAPAEELHVPVVVQLLQVRLEGLLVEGDRLRGQLLQVQAAHARGRALEPRLQHRLPNADALKDLRALVAVQAGDADLRHDLQQAAVDRVPVVLLRRLRVQLGQVALAHLHLDLVGAQPGLGGLQRQVGVRGRGAVAHQAGEVVRAPDLRRLHHDGRAHAQAQVDQPVVHRARGQQRGDVGLVGRDAALLLVREHNDLAAVLHRLHGLARERVQRLGQPLGPVRDVVQRGHHLGAEVRGQDLVHLALVEHGAGHGERARALLAGPAHVAAGAQVHLHAHDRALAQRVDGRVRHLREQLLEVVEHLTGLLGEHSQGRIVAHGPQGLLAAHAHGVEQHVQRLGAVPEQVQAPGAGGEVRPGRGGQLRPGRLLPRPQVQQVVRHPLLVGAAGGQLLLDGGVGEQLAALKVHQEHLPGLQPVLHRHQLVRQLRHHAHLAGDEDAVVLGDVVARGAQAVAVQVGAHVAPVRERHHGRPVPRLHHARVVLVERPLGGGDAGVVLPGLGDHHHDGLGQRALGALGQHLQRGVEVA